MTEEEIYKTPDNKIELKVQFENETIWLTQQLITNLFDRFRTVITKHINNIFTEGELKEESDVQKIHIANSDKPVSYNNRDVITSVGYRVKSQRPQFRICATQHIKDYLVQGCAINPKD